jgi:hypothetical protein
VSLSDKIAEARARAERTLAPEDWMVVRALEATETAERYRPPEPGDTSDLPPWSQVSRAD